MGYLILLVNFGLVAYQTDWSGGSGTIGPVNDWTNIYWADNNINIATPDQLSLLPTAWNYANWTKHLIETNSGIKAATQGIMAKDMDQDGFKDIIAHTNNEVVWYKNMGNCNFLKQPIGPAPDGAADPCVFPCDLDKDGNVDILVSTALSLGWYENQNPGWFWHSIDDSAYHRVSATDVELDGDIDVVAVDNSSGIHHGDIYLFRNDGSQNFTKELAVDLPNNKGWRVYPADFNGDSFPDIYAVQFNTYIFLNDGTGNFIQSFSSDYWSDKDFDGAWTADIDLDGHIDLICGNKYHFPYGFYALINDGTGTTFTLQQLVTDIFGSHIDGTIVIDIDLDGFPDIAGSSQKLGWARQDPNNPLNFTLYSIDNLNNSHWVYADTVCKKCIPSIDLLVTEGEAHIIYENKMQTFAPLGSLESSILEFASDSACTLKYFGYEACVPNDTSLAFFWRAGMDSADIVNTPWDGPHYASVGMNILDSFSLSSTQAAMFQYKAELNHNETPVLYEVWLTYECPPIAVEETVVGTPHIAGSLQFVDGKLVLYLPQRDYVKLNIYDISGRIVKQVFDGTLPPGTHEFEIPKKPGIYFAKLHYIGGVKTLKFVKLTV